MEKIAHSADVPAAPVAVLTRPPGLGRALAGRSPDGVDGSGTTVSGCKRCVSTRGRMSKGKSIPSSLRVLLVFFTKKSTVLNA